MVTKKCKLCGEEILVETKFSNRRYCDKCRYKSCPICGDNFLYKPKANKIKVFCSPKCAYSSDIYKNIGLTVSKLGTKHRLEHKDGYWVKCSWCGKNSYRYKVRKKRKDNFCNRKCFTEWSRSSRNKNWKGDNYPENFRLRRSGKYKKWRIEVFKRDNYTCQICGVIGKNLTADHIKSWALYPKLRFTLSNGRTLCKSCHYKTDTWGLKSVYQQLGTYPKN